MDIEVLSELIIKKICSVSTMYNEKNSHSVRKNRPLWALVIKYEGETHYASNGNDYVSNINNIAVLPKGCDYSWRCTKSGRFSIVEFECDKTHNGIFSFNVKNGEVYLKTIKKMEVNRTLKKTAYSLGYNNVYEFSRDFKKHMGLSPLKYAKSLLTKKEVNADCSAIL